MARACGHTAAVVACKLSVNAAACLRLQPQTKTAAGAQRTRLSCFAQGHMQDHCPGAILIASPLLASVPMCAQALADCRAGLSHCPSRLRPSSPAMAARWLRTGHHATPTTISARRSGAKKVRLPCRACGRTLMKQTVAWSASGPPCSTLLAPLLLPRPVGVKSAQDDCCQ